MSFSFADAPIRLKLMLAIFLTSLMALVMMHVTFLVQEFITHRQTIARHLTTLGEVVANNSTAALAFDNKDDATQILAALKADSYVVAAGLYDSDGTLFASYPAELASGLLPETAPASGRELGFTTLTLAHPVAERGRPLGMLYVRAETAHLLRQSLLVSALVALAVTGVILLLTYACAQLLQRRVSAPVLALAETARAVSERKDYSVRALKHGNDEIGTLTDAFNLMLARIHEHDQMRARFAAIVESTDDAIISKTLDGVITSWNPGAEKIFGYSADEAIGRPLSIIIPPERVNEEEGILDRMKRGEQIDHLETERIRKDGTRVAIAATISPVRDSQNRLIGISKIARDITDRKRDEAEIRRLNQHLEHRVIARTAQLEAANKELEAFSYSVSHDLRAPLRHIDGFATMLKENTAGKLDEESLQCLAAISRATTRMGVLIDDLLQFSRNGRADLVVEPVPLDRVVAEVRENLDAEIAGRTIRWQIAPLPVVRGDYAMLRQVFVNLLGNAVKYTRPRAEAVIEIGTAKGKPGEATLYVRDNGAGFDMKYVHKLFGVFQRLHNVSDFEGTGVGLANVHRIVERHGGRVWAEGEVDVGATFYVTLPLATKVNEARTDAPPPAQSPV